MNKMNCNLIYFLADIQKNVSLNSELRVKLPIRIFFPFFFLNLKFGQSQFISGRETFLLLILDQFVLKKYTKIVMMLKNIPLRAIET